MDAENVDDSSLGHITIPGLDDLKHDKITLGDHALEIDFLLGPMGDAQLFQKPLTASRPSELCWM